MFPSDFLSVPQNAELCSLIVLAPLDEGEKRGWLELLPLMDDMEKEILRSNLQSEIADFAELERMGVAELDRRIRELRS